MRFSSSPRCFSGEAVRDERSARGRSERGCAADGRAWRQERRLTPGEGWIAPRGYRPFVRRRTSVGSINSDGVSHSSSAASTPSNASCSRLRAPSAGRGLRIELHRGLSAHVLSLSHDVIRPSAVRRRNRRSSEYWRKSPKEPRDLGRDRPSSRAASVWVMLRTRCTSSALSRCAASGRSRSARCLQVASGSMPATLHGADVAASQSSARRM